MNNLPRYRCKRLTRGEVITRVFSSWAIAHTRQLPFFSHLKPIVVNHVPLLTVTGLHLDRAPGAPLHSHVVFISRSLCLTHRSGIPKDALHPAPNHFGTAHYPRVSPRSAVAVRRSKSSSTSTNLPAGAR